MKRLGILEKAIMLLTDNYITLEFWSDDVRHSDNDKLNGYLRQEVNTVIDSLTESFPELEILSINGPTNVDGFECLAYIYYSRGYDVKLTSAVDPNKIKEKCMELEIDKSGKRYLDIDVYYKGKKFSRKNPDAFHWRKKYGFFPYGITLF